MSAAPSAFTSPAELTDIPKLLLELPLIRTPRFALGNIGESVDYSQAAGEDGMEGMVDGIPPSHNADVELATVTMGGRASEDGDILEVPV